MTSPSGNPSRPSSGITSLIDLEIPGAVGPLPEPPAEPNQTLWGINHGAALDNFPLNGLQLYISAWLHMAEGDSVSVLLDDKMVITQSINGGEVGQRVTAFVDAPRLVAGNHKLQYSVKQFGQNAVFSAYTDISVKLDRPGGQDQNGDTPGHSALEFTLPEAIVNDGVDADDAEKGVLVTIAPYPNMTAGDNIKLSWGGEFVEHAVTSDEVGQPIEMTVVKDVIIAGGDSDLNGLAVTFEVYDVVQNRSEDWAAETRIVVDTGNSRLGAPLVREAFNGVLNLDTLAGEPITVQVLALTGRDMKDMLEELNRLLTSQQVAQLQASMGKETLTRLGTFKADFQIGDKIVVTLTGTTADNQAVSYKAETTIDYLPKVIEIPIPNAVIQQLAQNQAVFSYEAIHKDGPISQSRKAFIGVIGEAVRMAAPVALDAAQGAIDPNLATTTVEVPWDDTMVAGAQLTLKWIGTRPDLTIYDPPLTAHNITNGEAASQAPINFRVEGKHLKAIEGGSLELYFILAKEMDDTIVERESARAERLNIGEPRPELDAPKVEGVVDGLIDPAYGATTVTVPVYTGMVKGDVVHFLWNGSVKDLEDSQAITSFTENQPVNFDVKQEYISGNDAGTVEASYWVIRVNGRRSDSGINRFSVGKPVALDPPVISSVKDSEGQEIVDGGTTTETSVTLTGTAPANLGVEVLDGDVSKGKPIANASGQWTLPVSGLDVGAHVMTAKALYGENEVSVARGFTVAEELVAPTISSVKSASGDEIPDGGTTDETSVTVTGTAEAGLQVELFDGTTSKAEVTADAGGQWSRTITDLAVGAHAFKAIALDGSGSESAVHRFTIEALAAPTISSVKGASGDEIPAGGTTDETSVTVTGTAEAERQVELLDGTTSKGEVTANASGQWSLTISGLTVAAHAIKAKALYGNSSESAVRRFTIVPLAPPTISSVKGASGNEIPDGGTTDETSVTVTGTAEAGRQVELLDGTTSKGEVTANASGQWSRTITELAVGAHAFKAKALYGNGSESAVHGFTTEALFGPFITSIISVAGLEIPNYGSTFDTKVTVIGVAKAGREIELIDDNTFKGSVTTNASGQWRLTINDLAVGGHEIKAKLRYGNGSESAARQFTVLETVIPTIYEILDSSGEIIPDGGTTSSHYVNVGGTAAANQHVEVFDNGVSDFKPPVSNQGRWGETLWLTHMDGEVELGVHVVTAKAMYGDEPVSAPRTFVRVP